MDSTPLVSVIVPTRNNANVIEQCLASIQSQSYSDVELIVVDNNSTDGTPQLAAQYTQQIFAAGPERSAQRNHGVARAHGAFVLLADSDMVLSPCVLEECVARASSDRELKAVVVPEVSVGIGFWARCKALERSCYTGDDTIEAARFFERETFLRHGGYDEAIHGGGEDWDLPQRIRSSGGRIGRVQAHITHLEGRLSLADTMKKKHYYGKTIHRYFAKHPERARQQLRFFRPAFFRHRHRLIADPAHAAGLLFMKACEFAAGGAGYGQAYAMNLLTRRRA